MVSIFKLIKSLGYTSFDQEELIAFVWVNCRPKCNIFSYGSGTGLFVEDCKEVRDFLHSYFYIQNKFFSQVK